MRALTQSAMCIFKHKNAPYLAYAHSLPSLTPAPPSLLPTCLFKVLLRVLQIKHRRLVRSDRAVPPAYQQLLAQRADLYRQLQELQSQVPAKSHIKTPMRAAYKLGRLPCLKNIVTL